METHELIVGLANKGQKFHRFELVCELYATKMFPWIIEFVQ